MGGKINIYALNIALEVARNNIIKGRGIERKYLDTTKDKNKVNQYKEVDHYG